MSNGFRTDNELLARRAGAFDGLAERAGRIVDELRTSVDAHGECWGDDEVGQAFAEGHVAAVEAALAGIGGLPRGLADMRTQLIGTATTYAESEHTSHTAIRGVGREYA